MAIHKQIVLYNATPQQLEQAVACNHKELFCCNAIVQGGEVQNREGLIFTYNANVSSNIAFPHLTEMQCGDALDDMMNWYRAHPPKNVGCWSLDPPQPADIGIRLLARGFQPGWQPCWMALDLEKIITGYPTPAGLTISADNHTSLDGVMNLPYGGDNGAVSKALVQSHPEKAQRFIARLNGKIVGHSCAFFTTGADGVAGIYNVGVVPGARNQGIGKAVTIAACLHAKEKGYWYAVLNATYEGKIIYEQIGFTFLSNGCTWWLMNDRFITNPPSPAQIAFAEAIGRGDLPSLNALRNSIDASALNTPMNNDMTYMQLAVHCQQPAVAEWLVAHGAAYTVIDAWDIGWKDRAAALLQAHPDQVNQRYSDHQYTLLHMAAVRNDIALAELALSANPDLEIKDKIYDGTALGWAMFLKKEEIVKLIKDHQQR